MQHDITHILTDLISGTMPLRQVHFANPALCAPELALQVDFPRLEIVLEGSVKDQAARVLQQGDVLYVPAGGWNDPQWQTPATTLSILFGKQQLGFS
ncbi:AraC family transcriptional regulator, partial [Salmonella enterica subsp. enterica serovar Enteritidis]|nr:AraC family transcriptional regulator [Salmonella enterica subsp. enterica serovar Enteritidis]